MVSTQDRAVYQEEAEHGTHVTGWVGGVLFAGIIMFTGGFINILEGLVGRPDVGKSDRRGPRRRPQATQLVMRWG